jgi:hypothetical protein
MPGRPVSGIPDPVGQGADLGRREHPAGRASTGAQAMTLIGDLFGHVVPGLSRM